jgi:Family of unknown function (DUF6279)
MITIFNIMRNSFFSRLRIICAVLLALSLLGACSALRIGYGQAPELAYWWLDGYADFNRAQTPKVREALTDWFKWNRSTQLPDYAALLAKAEVQLASNATPAQACQWFDDVSSRFDVALERALPSLADIVLTATPEQLQHLEKRFAKGNKELLADFAQPDPADRLKASVKRSVERAESLYGKLDDAQRERVTAAVSSSPFDVELWVAERKARQQDVLQTVRRLLAEKASNEQAQAAVRILVERSRRSPRDNYSAYQQRLTQYNCAVAAQTHNFTTPAQRKFAAQKLKGWEGDLRALTASTVVAGN